MVEMVTSEMLVHTYRFQPTPGTALSPEVEEPTLRR
jgi:hypothetical protein